MSSPAQKRTYERGSVSGGLPGQMAFRREDILVYGMRRSRVDWSVRLLVRTEGYASLGTLYNSVILSIGTE